VVGNAQDIRVSYEKVSVIETNNPHLSEHYLPMSKMDLTPAETRPTGHRESSCKSAETSMADMEPMEVTRCP
jgi:hypothetical protein